MTASTPPVRWWLRPRTYAVIGAVLTAFAIELLPRALFWMLVSPIRQLFDLGAGTVQGGLYISCVVAWILFIVMCVVQVRRSRKEQGRVMQEWKNKHG
jgi:hypothetical protein